MRRRLIILAAIALASLAFQLCNLASDSAQREAMAASPTSFGYGNGPHYFPWYDDQYGQTWIMAASPAGGLADRINIFLQNTQMNPQPIDIAPGTAVFSRQPGSFGGPVTVSSQYALPGLVSERSLFGGSFEEVWAMRWDDLDSHYFWPLYDEYTPGSYDWIMVANPQANGSPVWVEMRLHYPPEYGGDIVETRLVNAGSSWAQDFPGCLTWPVEVQAWSQYGSKYNVNDARKVIATQRVLWNGAFNELPGIGASQLSSQWNWTWYDNASPGADSWICVVNPNAQDVYLDISIGGQSEIWGPLAPDDMIPLSTSSPVMDGPVQIDACTNPNNCGSSPANIYATQRSVWGPSFSEIAGSLPESSSRFCWTWYDELSQGSQNWVMISNLQNYPIYFEITIAGQLAVYGDIPANQTAIPHMPGVRNGPVEVNTWQNNSKLVPVPALTSQRVLWNGYFNEIFGAGMN